MLLSGAQSSGRIERFGIELSGPKDGINLAFAAPEPFVASAFRLYVNGVRLLVGTGNDYTITGPDSVALAFPLIPKDNISADYQIT